MKIFRLPNNLENISSKDSIFEYREMKIVKLINKLLEKRQLPFKIEENSPLSIFGTDLFFTHYSTSPIIKDFNPIEILELFREFLVNYTSLPAFKTIHQDTSLNEALSEYVTAKLLQYFLENLHFEASLTSGKEREAIMQLIGFLTQSCSKCRNFNKEMSKLMKSFSKIRDKVVNAFQNAVNQAFREAQTLTTLLSYGTEVGGLKKGEELAKFIWEAYEKTRKDFVKHILKIAEELKTKIEPFQKVPKKYGRKGIGFARFTTTKKVEHARATELALPDEIFWEKLHTGFTTIEKFELSEGALYLLIDKSGSMSGFKTIWARAVALALLMKAKLKKMKFYLRFFDSITYDRLEKDLEILEAILQIYPSGGTNINKAILTAIEDIEKNKLSTKTNTLVIITDGVAPVDTPYLIERLKKINTRLYYIHVDFEPYNYNKNLKEVSIQTKGLSFVVTPTVENALEVIEIV